MNQLSIAQKLLFSLGNFGSSGPNTIIVQLQLYYTKYLGYPAQLVGLVRSIALVLDAITDPLMGYISDNTVSRWGRRMPYIAIGALCFGLGTVAMWMAPAGLSPYTIFAYLLAAQIVFTVGVTMTTVPYNALVPEMATEYHARTSLVAWMQVGIYLGTTWGGFVRAYSSWRGDESQGMKEFAVLSSILMIICYGLLVAFVREPKRETIVPSRPRTSLGASISHHVSELFRSIRFAMTDSQFLVLFFVIFTYQVGILAGLWMYTFLLEDWFGGTWSTPFAEQYLTGIMSPFRDAFFLYIFFAVGGGIIFLPLWNLIGKRMEKRTCLAIGILGIGCTYAASYFLFAPKSFPLLLAYCFLQAFFYCPLNIYPISMLADIATHSEWKTGLANEGMFYGANSFLTKLYNAVAVFWTGFALDYIVKYKPGEGAIQTDETLWRMRMLYAFPALATALLAVFVLSRYRLNRATMEQITEELAARKQ